MKKWLYSSLAAALLLTAACQRHTANETGSDPDSLSATNDSLAPADRTHVDVDTVPLADTSREVLSSDSASGIGGARKPGQAPKPGSTGKVDSIKQSYPKKK